MAESLSADTFWQAGGISGGVIGLILIVVIIYFAYKWWKSRKAARDTQQRAAPAMEMSA